MARGRSNKGSKGSKSKKQAKKEVKEKKNGDFKGLTYIALGIILAIAIYTDLAGGFSKFAQTVIYNLVGVGAYIIPAFLIYFGVDSIMSKGTIQFSRRLFGVSLIVIIVTFAVSTNYISNITKLGSLGETIKLIVTAGGLHGGFISALITYPLYKALGFLGSFVLYITLSAMGAILVFDITLIDIIDYIKYEVLKIGEKVKNHKRERKEAYAEVEEEKVVKPTKSKSYNSNFIDVESNDEEQDLERNEFLHEVNNKIKILDFMKSSSLEDYDVKVDDSRKEAAVSRNVDIFKMPNEFEDDLDDINELIKVDLDEVADIDEKEEIINIIDETQNDVLVDVFEEVVEEKVSVVKKEVLNEEEKEVINKEIQESINEEDVVNSGNGYRFPDIELLEVNKTKLSKGDNEELMGNAAKLEETLNNFGVKANVVRFTKGPSVTRFELHPAPGVKVSKIVNLQDDIALGLAASGIRMEAPIPGKAAIGIEVPNKKQTPVFLREVLDSKEFKESNKNLAFSLGKDIAGKCIVGDLTKMPHTLIAGATGSGKSVCINTLIVSLLYKYSPEDVRLLMVDPKVVELSVYNGIPHLLIPVVTEPKKAAGALNWAVNEMERRYNAFAGVGARNIESYNSMIDKGIIQEKLPYIVIIVDELADLMMTCPGEVEDYICRLAQKARAAGMHLIIATQRPSVNVITGVIKANIPSRISFAVSSSIDSRTILDSAGAEKLLGRGDMLYYPTGESKPLRVQGAFISEEEVEKVVTFIKDSEKEAEYKEEILEHINKEAASANAESGGTGEDGDELLDQAIDIVIEYQQASTSFLQRKLRVGFNRASRIMDELEDRGIISEKDGSRPRQVLVTKSEMFGDD